MPTPIPGLHHVTAIASNPQQNLDFYTGVLGLRFVKRTVNFDDPGTYHTYFGDDLASPGTILTFFPAPHARRGHTGVGEVIRTAFSVPATALDFWHRHLTEAGLLVEHSAPRFNEQVLTFADPDGMMLEIVAHADAGPAHSSRFSTIPVEHAIRGFFGVTMLQIDAAATAALLNTMGFFQIAEEGNRLRFAAPATSGTPALGNHLDILIDPNATYGSPGAGSVHHIAFRALDDAAQSAWREQLAPTVEVTPILDRTYFHSIYFREPGGVLFELATDTPGFAFDEPLDSLGEALKLPPWLEPRRATIEQRLATLILHKQIPS